jgi:Domain of unknown function (DUF4314)
MPDLWSNERKGQRIELIRCADPYTRLRPGARGTISFEDSVGTVHVDWDDESHLGLIPGEDTWRFLRPSESDPRS